MTTFLENEYGCSEQELIRKAPLLRQSLRAMDNVLDNLDKFPRANVAYIEKHSTEIHIFLTVNCLPLA